MTQAPVPDQLGLWSVRQVVQAVESCELLDNTGKAVDVISRQNIDGSFLQRQEFSEDLLDAMFPSDPLQQLQFLTAVSEWRDTYDEIINVRTSDGEFCVLSKREEPTLSLSTRLRDLRPMIERKFETTLGVVVFRVEGADDSACLMENESLTRNQINAWGMTIFVDLNPKRIPRSLSLPGITVTTDPVVLDMITSDPASDQFPLALMPCHRTRHRIGDEKSNEEVKPALSAYSMTLHIQDCMRRCQYEIYCPNYHCRQKWDWDVCVGVAQLTEAELDEVIVHREKNRLLMTNPTKTCPNSECAAPISRPIRYKTVKVRCLVCSSGYFCWRCLNPWTGGNSCGNGGCVTEALMRCPDVPTSKWGKAGVPTLRACPRCDGVMRYQQACNHIICPNCSFDYCIICLQPYKGHNSSNCRVAPRQQC